MSLLLLLLIQLVAIGRERTTQATTFFYHLINSKINYVQSNCSVMCNACVRALQSEFHVVLHILYVFVVAVAVVVVI